MKKIAFLISMLCCLFMLIGCRKPVDDDFVKDLKEGNLFFYFYQNKEYKENEEKAKKYIKKYKNGYFKDQELGDLATKYYYSIETMLKETDNEEKSGEYDDAKVYSFLIYERLRYIYVDKKKPIVTKYTKNKSVIEKRLEKMISGADLKIEVLDNDTSDNSDEFKYSISGLVNTSGTSLDSLTFQLRLMKDGEEIDEIEEEEFYINNGLPFEITFTSDEDFDTINVELQDYKLLPEKFAKY